MEFLQHFERKQLARERCPNYILDGEALAPAHSRWIRDSRSSRRLSMVGLVDVGYEGRQDVFRKEKNGFMEEDKWRKGTI